MKRIFSSILILSSCLTFTIPAHAQVEPDYNSAINLLNLFEKQCVAVFPDFDKIRAEAKANSWTVGPLNHGQEVSWAVNEGSDNFLLMLVNNVSDSSKTCEVRGKASEDTVVGIFNGIYAGKTNAQRSGAPENSWMSPNGLITIQDSPDGRTSVILAK